MAFFKKLTTSVQTPGRQNAVIMGRKTWLSIPEEKRPIPNRINVVLTTTELDLKGPDYVTDSFDKAVAWLNSPEMKEKVEKVFVIGGGDVYKTAMNSDHHQVVYLTKVHADFECDAFFPEMDDTYKLAEEHDEDLYGPINIDHCKEMHEENGIKYSYEVYIKKGKK